MAVFALKGKGDLQWAIFKTKPNGTVMVVAVLNQELYIDQEMPDDQARFIWLQLVEAGWKRRLTPAGVNPHSLRYHIYD